LVGGKFDCSPCCCTLPRDFPVDVPAHDRALVKIRVKGGGPGQFKEPLPLFYKWQGSRQLVLSLEGTTVENR
jgi:hypothetical protein